MMRSSSSVKGGNAIVAIRLFLVLAICGLFIRLPAIGSPVNAGETTCTLTMAVTGEGLVTPEIGDHPCNCGDVVEIAATPAEGWQFDNWTGEVEDPAADVTTITMNDNQTVTASFSEMEIEQPETCTLTMAVTGEGLVTPGIGDHPCNCGDVIEIAATPAEGWQFDNWTGEVEDPAADVTTITMNDNQTVTASFSEMEIEQPETCTLTMAVTGEGLVTPEIGDHPCNCGGVIEIAATPAEGWQFDNWTGEVEDPAADLTTITMNDNQTVTANFIELDHAAPIVMCGWEQEPVADLESGDPSHRVPGSQVLPPLAWGATKTVDCYVVVTDTRDGGDVDRVYARVYYPVESPASYRDARDPEGLDTGFKCEVVFTRIDDPALAAALIEAAGAAGIVSLAPGCEVAGLTGADGAVTRGTAALWYGRTSIEFDEPAGDYGVRSWALDNARNQSDRFEDAFNYVPVSGVEVDFTGIEYGSVRLGIEGVQAGDRVWGEGLAGEGSLNKATVRNIGNTWAHVTVEQRDMGFGTDGGASGTALVSSSPLGASSNWKVNFGVCLGDDPGSRLYFDPDVLAVTPNYLELSASLEIEFSILVKAGAGTHWGEMTIASTIEPFSLDGGDAGPA